MADLRTDSVTKRWPHTLSRSAFFVTSLPGDRASAHHAANGLRRERHWLPGACESRIGLVELETLEVKPHDVLVYCHGCTPLVMGKRPRRARRSLLREGEDGRHVPGMQWRGRKIHSASLGTRPELHHCAEVQQPPANGFFDYDFGVALASARRTHSHLCR